MIIHVHDNNDVPEKHNCLGEFELEPGNTLSLHLHPGECRPCPQGHCHWANISVLQTSKGLFIVFEGVRPPTKITLDQQAPHSDVAH
jgi:hypothetical protein